MNIVFVSEFFPTSDQGELRGGTEARVFYVARNLAARHTVTVLSSIERGMERETRFFGGKLRVLRCGPERIFTQSGDLAGRYRFMRAAHKELRTLKGDIIDAQNLVAYAPAWASRRGFAKSVATIHDVWLGRWMSLFGPAGFIGELYERYILSCDWDGFVANSESTKERLVRSGRTPDKVSVIYNGIDVAEGRTATPKYTVPTIVFVGRLVEYKRVQDILAALPIVLRTVPAVVLRIIGVGPYEKVLRQIVRDSHLESHVQFLGHLPSHQSVRDEIRKSHVLCLPSVIEGFGMVTVEAMAEGTPFVNADIPVTQEVTQGNGGLTFAPKNPENLARQLYRVLNDQKLASQLGEHGQKFAQHFAWENIAQQTEQFYGRILEE